VASAPQPQSAGNGQAPAAAAGSQAETAGTAAISGTVLDSNGSEVQGATVQLESLDGRASRSEQSGGSGEFTFTDLQPGRFTVTVSGKGWGTFTSTAIALSAGEFYIVPKVVLPLMTSVSVRVIANREELAEEQVSIAEQQRILGVFPNFYTSFDWNAAPLGPKQKIQLALRSITDPVELLGPVAVAGFEQEANVFPGYGGGAEGYGKRLGAAYLNSVSSKLLANAVYPSLFHQDPRYFYKGTGSFRSRAAYAICSAFVTRGDSGRREMNYSYILGTFTAGALSNFYYPPENRGALLTFTNGLADIAGDAGANLVKEFVFSRFTTRARFPQPAKPLPTIDKPKR
jgi:hypothetical protein